MQHMTFLRAQCPISFFRGTMPPDPPPPYIIRAFGADIQSARFSPVTWSLMFSYRKTPYLYKTNDDTASGWSRSLNGGDQKSRESLIRKKILVKIMNHWGKNDRNYEYQDSNDFASTPDKECYTSDLRCGCYISDLSHECYISAQRYDECVFLNISMTRNNCWLTTVLKCWRALASH